MMIQLGVAVAGLGGLALAPAAQGRMLLIPLVGGASASAAAVKGGARLLAAGPFPGSLIVMGQRGRIGAEALERGILVLAAPALLCAPSRRSAEAL